MSNFLAIATVTATLKDLLQEAMGNDEPVARVTTARPDDSVSGSPETRVNIYL
jgi:precorrin-4 methylase